MSVPEVEGTKEKQMKKIIVLAQLLGLFVGAYGQQYPYFSQHFLNPFLYNPAALGNSGYNEINLTYRQQWLGINDAPITQAFNFQYPTRKNISFGASFYNDKAVLLNTSSLIFGLAYQVNISEGHFIKFGLSTGVGLNNFDLGEVDNPNDPALRDVLSQTSFLTGQFGIYYNIKGLKLGFSLPQLYKYSALDTTDFQKVTIDQLDNYILTASYNFDFGISKVSLEPFALYRKSEMLPTIVEVGAMLDYNNLFWVGGSYRKDYGGTGYVGVNIMKNISFAYAYEFAGGQQVNLGNGSHEFNFKIKFGKNKHEKAAKMLAKAQPSTNSYMESQAKVITPKVAVPVVKEEISGPETEDNEEFKLTEAPKEENDPLISEVNDIVEIEEVPFTPREDPNFDKPKPTFEPGYYVVLGAFEIYDNAISYSSLLQNKGIKVDYGYVEDRGLYYLFNMHTQSFEEAKKMQQQFMKLGAFKDAWVYEVK